MFIQKIVERYRKNARAKRKIVFLDNFSINKSTRLLDIGSESGTNIHYILEGKDYRPENIFIADIYQSVITEGQRKYNYTPVLLRENGLIPFPDKYFDITYCSSVIEHVTVAKNQVASYTDDVLFASLSKAHQQVFVDELRRVSKAYFVQTPNKDFLIESHTWLPFLGWCPRSVLISILNVTNKFWVKKTSPDFYLLNKIEFGELFKGDKIIVERSFMMVKSWMAIRKESSDN